MADYVIFTDSTADLTVELIDQLEVQVIPLEVTINEKTNYDWPDHRDLAILDFYNMLREGKKATTSLINVDRFIEEFKKILDQGKDILYIAFSSALSGSYSCSVQAAEKLRENYPDRKIFVVDSLAASMGEGLLVYLAVQKKNAGLSITDLASWIEEKKLHICHWFTVDDLNHLRRGGRISRTTAVFGTMLNIKPILHVDNEGRLISMSKARGRSAALLSLVDHLEKTGTDIKGQTIMISHADAIDDCMIVVREIRKRFGVKNIFLNDIGPVIGAHAGPGTIALFFVGTER